MHGRYREDDSFVEFVCDQLEALDGIAHRRMFGGYGLYCGSTFFGIVYRDALYFKTDEDTRQKYIAWEMAPFQPRQTQTLKSYYQVPAEFIEDAARLRELAGEAIDVALRTA